MEKTDVYMKLKEPLVLASTIAALVVMSTASSTGLLLPVYADSTNADVCGKGSSEACLATEHGSNPSRGNPSDAKSGEGKSSAEFFVRCVRGLTDCGP
jgi:hypothetical protein